MGLSTLSAALLTPPLPLDFEGVCLNGDLDVPALEVFAHLAQLGLYVLEAPQP